VWEAAARWPAALRPDFTAMIGLLLAISRASRANLLGFPKDSRYSKITSVRSSTDQYATISFPEMSALLPTETNEDRPSPSSAAYCMTASPSAPDCDEKPTRPAGGYTLAKVPFSRTFSAVLTIPMQFGPIRRMPYERQVSKSLACL
jgi:hypothetical protein